MYIDHTINDISFEIRSVNKNSMYAFEIREYFFISYLHVKHESFQV